MVALQPILRARADCKRFVSRLPCFFFTLLLWIQWHNSLKRTLFFLSLKPLVCAIVVFDHDWNAVNHSRAASSLSAFTYAFSSNCIITKFSAVLYDGNSLNFSIK